MNKEASDAVRACGGDEPVLRRFPHRSREDLAVLAALSPEQRREFDRLLHAQHDADVRERRHAALVDRADLEALAARAHFGDGAGGGRRAARR